MIAKTPATQPRPQNLRYILQRAYRRWTDDWNPAVKWRLSPQRRESLRRLRSFRNLHRGQRCFIIGNGPSLRQMDLGPLRSELTLGLNRIYMLFDKIGFATSYLISVNKLFIEQCAREIAPLPMPKFLSWRGLGAPVESANTVFVRTSYDTGFSVQPEKLVYESATVTVVALQLAYYMGFSKVVLIGVDHFFTSQGRPNTTVVSEGNDPNHFDPGYFEKGFRWQLPDLRASERGYRLARQAFEADGRQIVDATVGGKLEVFPKVSYADLVTRAS